MKNEISIEQRFALLAAIGANADWDSLTVDEVQRCIKEAQRIGPVFTKHVKGGFQFVGDAVPAVAPAVVVPKLLKRIGTFAATPVAAGNRFVVRERFSLESKDIQFAYIDPEFLAEFGDMEIGPRDGFEVASYELLRDSVDGPIQAELPENHFTDPAVLWDELAKQPRGGNGQLLADGSATIFYMPNKAGVPRAVFAFRDDVGWYVSRNPVENRSEWFRGNRIVSRNPAA